jgi:hypothetical protein
LRHPQQPVACCALPAPGSDHIPVRHRLFVRDNGSGNGVLRDAQTSKPDRAKIGFAQAALPGF